MDAGGMLTLEAVSEGWVRVKVRVRVRVSVRRSLLTQGILALEAVSEG